MLPPLKFLGEAEENVSRETSHIAFFPLVWLAPVLNSTVQTVGNCSRISSFSHRKVKFSRDDNFVRGRSLRSKRFRLVSEQRKTEEGDSRFWPREK